MKGMSDWDDEVSNMDRVGGGRTENRRNGMGSRHGGTSTILVRVWLGMSACGRATL
jgi:hypothetical protein